MEINDDLQDYIDNRHDMSCEIENLEEELKREITADERIYFENQFVEYLKKNFYE